MPILVAADRAGATLSHTLPSLNSDSVKQALEPDVAQDALLVSDANRCHPPVAAAPDIPHESINVAVGARVRGALHIHTVNGRCSQIKGFLRAFRGIATKYLDSYLRWFHLIELGDQPSPRACLEAAMARPCIRFANRATIVFVSPNLIPSRAKKQPSRNLQIIGENIANTFSKFPRGYHTECAE